MKHIILTGPKHCGKTSVAKALGKYFERREDFALIDLDEEIKKKTGKTPRELYAEGTDVFKKAEIEAAIDLEKHFCDRKEYAAVVIAAGGGIIDNREAANIIKELDAIKVLLNISAEAAWLRISAAGDLPPFLRTDNPQETHRILHERRTEAYRKFADTTIETEGKTPQKIAEEIFILFWNDHHNT